MTDLRTVFPDVSKRVSHSFSIREDLLQWLRDTSEHSDVSQSEIVNRAIRLFIRVHDPGNKNVDGEIMVKALVEESRPVQGDGNGTCTAGFQVYDRKTCNKFIIIRDGLLSCSQAGEDGCPFQEEFYPNE